jgi:hypothetical protein
MLDSVPSESEPEPESSMLCTDPRSSFVHRSPSFTDPRSPRSCRSQILVHPSFVIDPRSQTLVHLVHLVHSRSRVSRSSFALVHGVLVHYPRSRSSFTVKVSLVHSRSRDTRSPCLVHNPRSHSNGVSFILVHEILVRRSPSFMQHSPGGGRGVMRRRRRRPSYETSTAEFLFPPGATLHDTR